MDGMLIDEVLETESVSRSQKTVLKAEAKRKKDKMKVGNETVTV